MTRPMVKLGEIRNLLQDQPKGKLIKRKPTGMSYRREPPIDPFTLIKTAKVNIDNSDQPGKYATVNTTTTDDLQRENWQKYMTNVNFTGARPMLTNRMCVWTDGLMLSDNPVNFSASS
jgi:hypothetical protein